MYIAEHLTFIFRCGFNLTEATELEGKIFIVWHRALC